MRWGIVATSAVFHAIALAQLGDHPQLQPAGTLDDGVYVALAQRVARGDLAIGPEPFFLAPLYTYLLGLVFAVTGESAAAARLVQCVLGVAGVWMVIDTATRWFGRRAGLVAGALIATTGLVVFNELLILQSSLDPFLTACALWTATRAMRAPSLRGFATTGAALALLALNRPNAIACVPAMAAGWWLVHRSRQGAQHAAILVLGAALVIAPATIRNRVVSGEWVLITSHGGLNFYIGNASGADGTWKAVPGITPSIAGQVEDVRRVASKALGHPATAREASDYFYEKTWGEIASQPGTWLRLLLRKVALTFSAHDAALNRSFAFFAGDERTVLRWLVVGPWLLVPLGLVGFACAAPRDRRRDYVAWLVFLPAYALTLVAFFVSSRYRLPMLVALSIGAGGGVAWAVDCVRSSSWTRVVLATGASVAVAVMIQWPLGTDDGRMNERMERIVSWIREGRVDQALSLLAQTEGSHPDPALLLYRVGMELRTRDDLRRAILHLERAHEIAPDSGDVSAALGEALLAARRPGEALPHLEAAHAAKVAPNETSYQLAHAYHALGREAEARAALSRIAPASATTVDAAFELGQAAFQVGDAGLAEAFFSRATRLDPTQAAAWEALGVARGAQGKGEEGIEALRRAVALDGSRTVAHVHLALLYARAGQREAAMAEVASALRLAPNHTDARRLHENLRAGR